MEKLTNLNESDALEILRAYLRAANVAAKRTAGSDKREEREK